MTKTETWKPRITQIKETAHETHEGCPAAQLIERIISRSQQIADFPLSGRLVPEYEMEQIWEVIEGSYRIIYYVKPDQINVLAVIHGHRNIFY